MHWTAKISEQITIKLFRLVSSLEMFDILTDEQQRWIPNCIQKNVQLEGKKNLSICRFAQWYSIVGYKLVLFLAWFGLFCFGFGSCNFCLFLLKGFIFFVYFFVRMSIYVFCSLSVWMYSHLLYLAVACLAECHERWDVLVFHGKPRLLELPRWDVEVIPPDWCHGAQRLGKALWFHDNDQLPTQ